MRFLKVVKIDLTPKNFDNHRIKRNRLYRNVLKLQAIKEIKRTVAPAEIFLKTFNSRFD